MMKHRKKVIGVALVFLIGISVLMVNTIFDVTAASNKPSKCTDKDALLNYYGMSYDWNDNMTAVTFSVKHGSFRISSVDTTAFTNVLVKGADDFYTVDGGTGTLTSKNKLTLKFASKSFGSTVKIKFALSASDSICDSLTDYKTKKAAKQKTATFETGTIELEVPAYGRKDEQVTQENKNYNGICKAVRDGTDPTGKIDPKILKLFDSSAEARAQYQTLVPGCFQTQSVYDYEVDDMAVIIKAALNSWDLIKTSSVGEGAKDVSGDAWLLNFADVVAAAKAEGHAYFSKDNGQFYKLVDKGNGVFEPGAQVKDNSQSFAMKCNVKAKSATDFSNLLEHNADGTYNITANIQNYYAVNQIIKYATYKWNYTRGNSLKEKEKQQTVKVCTRTCEEAVKVEYGPPVASKAGLCFEYQVRVTSRVKCKSKINAEPPKEPKICTPIPRCNSIPGYTHQAGGNDEYSKCIQKCDGGKYTEKCSDKCYKKVYEKSTVAEKTKLDEASENIEKMYSKTLNWNGSHYWSGGSIKWSGSGYARYYKYFEKSRTIRDHGSYYAVGGFKKRHYGGGNFCKDPCRYKGCSQKQYLNKKEAKADYKANIKKYEQAVAECKASSSCTRKTAVFKISVDYTTVTGKTVPIEYPLTNKEETLVSDEEANACTNNPSVTGKENIILNYAGCYKHCGSGTQYHSHWSFPGSWLNKKTGELSFTPETGKGWTEKKDKFCLPLDVQDTNVKWWNYYYGIYNKSHKTSYTNPSTSVKDICKNPGSVTNVEESDIKNWQIKASTRKFGYFGWNFDISCFYAINSSSTAASEDNNEKCNPEPTSSGGGKATTSYRIRTVDLKNLFPAAEGKTGSREPGFNWSDNATISQELGKNPSNPITYAQQVESTGYSAYSDTNVDYRLVLTKNTIQQIKGTTKNRNYADFKGDVVTRNGMETYESNVIRGGIKFGPGTIILDKSTLGCNNTQGNSCDTSSHRSKEA